MKKRLVLMILLVFSLSLSLLSVSCDTDLYEQDTQNGGLLKDTSTDIDVQAGYHPTVTDEMADDKQFVSFESPVKEAEDEICEEGTMSPEFCEDEIYTGYVCEQVTECCEPIETEKKATPSREETEVYVVEYEEGSNGEWIVVFETVYYSSDIVEEDDCTPVEVVSRSYYSLTIYGEVDTARLLNSVRTGLDDFIEEAMKKYGSDGNYFAGLDEYSAGTVSRGLFGTYLVLPKDGVRVDYFGVTYYPSDDFLAISYSINGASYTFRYEKEEQRGDWRTYGNYTIATIDGNDFKLYDSDKGDGSYFALIDHNGLDNKFVVLMMDGENCDLDQFEFFLAQ